MTGAGASHDVVEQGLYDEDVAADHFCVGGHGNHEGGQFALRLQLGVGIGGGLIVREHVHFSLPPGTGLTAS
jgi:hypothetical protein